MRVFNRAIRVLLMTNSLVLVAGAMLGPIYALFVEEIGGDLLDASFTGATFAIAAALTTLLAAKYEDRLPRKEKMITLGYVIVGLGFLGYALVRNIWTLFAVQVVIGFGEAIYAPAFDAVYGEHVTPKKEAREWGAWEAMDYLVGAIGAIVGGLTVYVLSFSALFYMMAILCFASAWYLSVLPKRAW